MSTGNTAVFTVRFTGDKKDLEKAIKDVGGKLDEVEKKSRGTGTTGNLFESLTAQFNKFKGAIVAGGILTGLGMMLKEAIDTADKLGEMAEQVGVSAEALSTLNYASTMSGIAVESFNSNLIKLNKNLYEASLNSGPAKDAINNLGIQLLNSQGAMKTTDQILLDVADRFKDLPDGIQKTAYATQIFGRSGAEMVLMLNKGSEGIRELQQEARDLGLEISSNFARQAGEFNDNLDRMKSVGSGVGLVMASELMPALNQIFGGIAQFVRESKVASVMGQGIAMGVKILAGALMVVAGIVQTVATGMGAFGAAVVKVFTLDIAGASRIWEMGKQQMAQTYIDYKNMIGGLLVPTEVYNNKVTELQNALSNIVIKPKGSLVEAIEEAQRLKEKYKEIAGVDSIIEQQIRKWQQTQADSIRKATEDAKKLYDEWKRASDSMQDEAAKKSMGSQLASLYDMDSKVAGLIDKYKSIPGALKNIELYQQSMFRSLLNEIGRSKEGFKEMYDRLKNLTSDWAMDLKAKLKSTIVTAMIPIAFLVPPTFASDMQKQVADQVNNVNMEFVTPIQKTKLEFDLPTADIIDFIALQQETSDTFGMMADAAGAFYELSGQKAGLAFTLYKSFAIAQTTIATYQSAMEAFKTVTGLMGPAAGYVAAAAATAFGLARVAQIANMRPGNSGGGAGGGSSITRPPSSGSYSTTNNYNTTHKSSSPVEVRLELNGSFYGDQDKFARDISKSLQKLFDDGVLTIKS